MKNLYSGTHRGGFQFLLILDLWGISFHAVIVFGLGKNLLFKSALGHCEELTVHVYTVLLTNQTCCKMNTSQSADEYYYVGTGIVPHSVYIVSCIYMAIVFVVGFIANIGIFIIFVSSPLVSSFVHSDKSRFKILRF